jgi:deoxyribonuclease V
VDFAVTPRWDLPIPEAAALQRQLAARVSLDDRVRRLDLVAGIDLALGRYAGEGRAAVVVWRSVDGEVVEQVTVEQPLRMPYVPGLLAFREGPLAEAALRSLRAEPDLLLFDGQGIAHPRGLGIAAHLGVLLDRPAVGVAKSRLFGRADEPGPYPGDRADLLAPDGRRIGIVLRTRLKGKPLWVSPGHAVSVDRAAECVMACLRGHRLPEPVWLADRLSKARLGQ